MLVSENHSVASHEVGPFAPYGEGSNIANIAPEIVPKDDCTTAPAICVGRFLCEIELATGLSYEITSVVNPETELFLYPIWYPIVATLVNVPPCPDAALHTRVV